MNGAEIILIELPQAVSKFSFLKSFFIVCKRILDVLDTLDQSGASKTREINIKISVKLIGTMTVKI